jgi:hypothetical protein
MQVLNVPRLEDILKKVNEISSRLLVSKETINHLLVNLIAEWKIDKLLDPKFYNRGCKFCGLHFIIYGFYSMHCKSDRPLLVALIVFPQATKLSDLDQWRDPLAAIVLYTFDLSILFPRTNPEQNFYFSLNKVQAGIFLLF